MDKFSSFNPKATLLFYLLHILTVIIIFNPILITISFIGAFIYKTLIEGKKSIKYLLTFIIPLILFVAAFNLLFSHYGMTLLFAVGDYRFTLESLFYGFSQGLLLATVILWFNIYSKQITSECFISAFGGVASGLVLVFSMTLSFIPRLKKNARLIKEARELLNTNESNLKKSISNFSALVSLTLEESIETADSMRARGYNKDRSVYSKYRFSLRDFLLILFELILFTILMIFRYSGLLDFIFEPVITYKSISVYAYTAYSLFAFLPVIIDFAEGIKWHYLKQKI